MIPTDHPYTLRPNIGIQSTRRNQSNLSNYERKQSLTEAFGSKKKQRAQRAASSNIISSENISGVGAIESAMNGLNEAAAIAGTETVLDGATKAQEFNRAQLLPAYDLSTDDVTKVYPIEALIPSAVMRCLGDVFDTMYAEYIPGASLLEHFDTKLKVMSSLKSVYRKTFPPYFMIPNPMRQIHPLYSSFLKCRFLCCFSKHSVRMPQKLKNTLSGKIPQKQRSI